MRKKRESKARVPLPPRLALREAPSPGKKILQLRVQKPWTRQTIKGKYLGKARTLSQGRLEQSRSRPHSKLNFSRPP